MNSRPLVTPRIASPAKLGFRVTQANPAPSSREKGSPSPPPSPRSLPPSQAQLAQPSSPSSSSSSSSTTTSSISSRLATPPLTPSSSYPGSTTATVGVLHGDASHLPTSVQELLSSAEAAGRLHRQELDAAWRAVGAACARAEAAERRAEMVREERVVDDGHLRERVAFLERRAREHEGGMEEAEARVASASERAGQLEAQLSSAHEAAHGALTEAAFMRGVLEESDSLCARKEEEVMELRGECERLQGSARDAQAGWRDCEGAREALQRAQGTLTQALAAAVGERDAALGALRASEERAGALAARLVSAEEWRVEAEGRVEGLVIRCSEAESRGGEWRERVEALGGQLQASVREVEALESRGREREGYIERMGVEIALLQASLGREKERWEGVEAGYQRELGAASLRLSACEARAAGMEVERRHEEARVVLLQGALDEREVRVRELEGRVRELEEEGGGGGVMVAVEVMVGWEKWGVQQGLSPTLATRHPHPPTPTPPLPPPIEWCPPHSAGKQQRQGW